MTNDEIEYQIRERNSLTVSLPQNLCIHNLIDYWIDKTPNSIAIVNKNQNITYKQLYDKSLKVTKYLITNGINSDDKVGTFMNRSIETIITFIGILRSGAAYVPLDPLLPQSRLEYMILDSEVKMIICDNNVISSEITTIDYFAVIDNSYDLNIQVHNIPEDNLAYIKYTSGSTGKPKGVMITHKNIVGFLYSYQPVVNIKGTRIGTCVAPLNFDTSIEEIYSCICFGGTVHLMDLEQMSDFEYFAEYIVNNNINVSYIIPDFLDEIGKYLKKYTKIPLQTLITGLHAKKNRIFKNFLEFEHLTILNAYGPTEVTYGSTAYQVNGTEEDENYTPIGMPFPNYQSYVVDSQMQLLPDLIPGEHLIGGVGLSSGYINKPENTKKHFINIVLNGVKTKVYRSGDLVCWSPDGNLQFLGRKDNQVKINGYRIEISEIEYAINKISYVHESIVVRYEQKNMHDKLIAYIVLKKGIDSTGKDIKDELKNIIPNYMIPTLINIINIIPRFPNGKINYKLLEESNLNTNLNRLHLLPPKTKTEKILKKIFEENLKTGEISVSDNFFEVGGDSLTAIRIIIQIEDALDQKIPLSYIYSFPTIRILAHELDKNSDNIDKIILNIRQGDNQFPVFFVHSLDGSVLTYRHIINNLNDKFKIFGLQTDYDEDSRIQNTDIVNIAKGYIDELLKNVNNDNIIALVGYSFGGILAFEMASQLEKLGYITKLVMVDSRMDSFYKKKYPNKFKIISGLNFIKWIFIYSCKYIYRYIKTNDKDVLRKYIARIRFEIFKTAKRSMQPVFIDPQYGEDINKTMQKSLKLADDYEPKFYAGNTLLIKCTDEVNGRIILKSRSNFLSKFKKGKLIIERIEALHSNVKDDKYAKHVAQHINKFLID